MTITRRNAVAFAAIAATTPIIGAHAASNDVPVTDVPPLEYKLETGATLRVLRPAKFVDADESVFRANSRKFTEKTGVEVSVDFMSFEDLRPRTEEIAEAGTGADIVVGFSADPHAYASRIVDMTDLANYLGTKYGGWYDLAVLYGTKWKSKEWISIPMGGLTAPTIYRRSWIHEAGYESIPNDLEGFLALCQKLAKIGHPCGFSLGHALLDGSSFVSWALWAHNAFLVDEAGKIAIDSKETIAALKYIAELYKTMVPGTLTWLDISNNQAYLAGQIGLTFNPISIYYVAKNSKDPRLQAIAADSMHQSQPFGNATRRPQSTAPLNAMVFKHSKYPNAAKDYLRFMMESEQYGPWLSETLGYYSNSLKAYSQMKFWETDPNYKPYMAGMDTPYYDGYKGPITAAASKLTADYVLVDMFASVATGSLTPEAAAKQAARQALRYYKNG